MDESFETRFVKARREIIRREYSFLNDCQQEAVLTTEGPLLLLAGAGSGKTTVLINRISNLIEFGRASDSEELPDEVTEEDLKLMEAAVETGEVNEYVRSLCALDPVDPWRILAITFTNKAAGELKTRLYEKLGDVSKGIWAQTFHSACVRILHQHGDAIGVPKSFTVYDSSDSVSVMKRIIREQKVDDKLFPPKNVLGAVSRAKDAMQTPEIYAHLAEKERDKRKAVIASLYKEYQNRLLEANALDFDDIIFDTVLLLQNSDETREYYQRYFKYVLIDEYQDTSEAQYILASLLAGGRENICVVGDDDQSIYKFRGATIENILHFEDRYNGAKCIKLEQNYRSTKHILNASNSVISNNIGRKGKQLWTNAEDGDKLTLYMASGDEDEAAYVAARILEGVSGGMKFSDFAVLFRMNAQSNRLEYALKRNSIPYKVFGGMRFFDRAEIKDMTAYLATIYNPSDDTRLLRIINTPTRGIGNTSIERLRNIAALEHKPIFYVLSHSGNYADLKTANLKLQKFYQFLYEMHKLSETMPLDEFYDLLLEKTKYIESLGKNDEALAKRDNIEELKSNIVNYMSSVTEPTLGGFLDEIALFTDIDKLDENSDYVTMMTMHSAKGLEFPTVFIVGMEDGIFPPLRSIGSSEDMEEERRLCYVAMTRAKKRLYLTAARRRMLFGHTAANSLSRFVNEIPDEDIQKVSAVRPHTGTNGEDTASSVPTLPRHKTAYQRRQQRIAEIPDSLHKPAVANKITLKRGDEIHHTAFGDGTVTEVKSAGSDTLITVKFKDGEKHLMLKAAGSYIKKI